MANEVHFALDRPGSRQQRGKRESPSAPLAETSPTHSPQWKQWRATIRPHTFANNVLCTVMATGRGACAAIQPNTGCPLGNRRARVFHERENSGLLFAASALSCNFGLVARRQIFLCSQLGSRPGGSLSSLPFAVCRTIQASGG